MLKVLKGARILVDCESGDLHVDLGDGNCKPIGGGNNVYRFYCEIQGLETDSPSMDLLQGDYFECMDWMDPTKSVEFVDVVNGLVIPFVGFSEDDMGPKLHFQRLWFDFTSGPNANEVVGVWVQISPNGTRCYKLPYVEPGPL